MTHPDTIHGIEQHLADIDVKLARLDGRIDKLQWMVGLVALTVKEFF
jgi:archaellum component FlaC